MARAYPGYVYQPYPRMIYSKDYGVLGYKIVNSEEEEKALLNKPEPVKKVEPVAHSTVKSKLKYTIEG
jgi:hypothetical protein